MRGVGKHQGRTLPVLDFLEMNQRGLGVCDKVKEISALVGRALEYGPDNPGFPDVCQVPG
jgi:hypothetical protein